MPTALRQQAYPFGSLRKNPHWSVQGLKFYSQFKPAGKLIDESPYGNNGNITGATWVGNALDFANDGDEINFSANPLPFNAGEDFTFILVADIDSYVGVNAGFWRVAAASDGTTWIINQGANSHVWVRVNGVDVLKPSSGIIQPTGLHHQAWVVKSGSWVGWYLDGILSQENTHSTATDSIDIYRFGWQSVDTQRVDGRWFTASLYNRALSSTEIAALDINPNLPMQQPPIWLFSPPVVVGTTPKGPLGHPLYGPFAGPIAC